MKLLGIIFVLLAIGVGLAGDWLAIAPLCWLGMECLTWTTDEDDAVVEAQSIDD
jgi:hypothetical protein